jgi:hypothetical protein
MSFLPFSWVITCLASREDEHLPLLNQNLGVQLSEVILGIMNSPWHPSAKSGGLRELSGEEQRPFSQSRFNEGPRNNTHIIDTASELKSIFPERSGGLGFCTEDYIDTNQILCKTLNLFFIGVSQRAQVTRQPGLSNP